MLMSFSKTSMAAAPGSTIMDLPVSLAHDPLVRPKREDKTPNKKIIRDMGLKVTSQRLLILETVRSGASHFTAQDVYETVSASNSEIGFATVYRFLRMLSEKNHVTEVRIGGLPARYEWAKKRHHDHLTCVECARIVEFENSEIERLQERVAKQFGFTLSNHVLELYGTCPQCKEKSTESQAR